MLPLFTVNCWPQESGNGTCEVNIEYILENNEMQMDDVSIIIPVTPGAPPPVINECENEHEYDKLHSSLIWRIPVIDANNATAIMVRFFFLVS